MYLYSDDIQIWVNPAVAVEAIKIISTALGTCGLQLKDEKTKVWGPESAIVPPELAKHRVRELKCLGTRLIRESDAVEPAMPSLSGSPAGRLQEASSRISSFS